MRHARKDEVVVILKATRQFSARAWVESYWTELGATVRHSEYPGTRNCGAVFR